MGKDSGKNNAGISRTKDSGMGTEPLLRERKRF